MTDIACWCTTPNLSSWNRATHDTIGRDNGSLANQQVLRHCLNEAPPANPGVSFDYHRAHPVHLTQYGRVQVLETMRRIANRDEFTYQDTIFNSDKPIAGQVTVTRNPHSVTNNDLARRINGDFENAVRTHVYVITNLKEPTG